MKPNGAIDLRIEDSKLRAALAVICRAVRDAGGRALLVGGCVRDAALGVPAKDLDVEVYGVSAETLQSILSDHFGIDLVGEAFCVIKIHGLPIDVSLPRRESKTGLGHRGFTVLSDPNMSVEEAASRRDFTMNAMAFDPVAGDLIDPHGGLKDLKAAVLRHTAEKFVEDPLRVLRAMQFAARFELTVAAETVRICSGMEPAGLPPERLFEEWRRLVLMGRKPSLGLAFLRECGWSRHFPELHALIGVEQEPEWHPEGDVWVHTLHCMDAFAAERIGDEWEDLVVGFAILCHDFGKPATTEIVDGRIRCLGHEDAGEEPARAFLARLTLQRDLAEEIVPLVRRHLRPQELYEQRESVRDKAIRRLALSVGRIDRLVRVARADQMGRAPIPFDGFPAGDWLMERARALDVVDTAPKPIVMGRHLIELGLKPGPHFTEILQRCYQAQLEGEFSTPDDGLDCARRVAAGMGFACAPPDVRQHG